MAIAEATELMTTEQMLALPDNGVERWLICGQLREKPMTVRNRWHSAIMASVTFHLINWLNQLPLPRGKVLCGEAGVRLTRDPDTTVGVDVVYISAKMAAHQPNDTTLIDGPPILVVEILSPNDTQDEIDEKVDRYLAAGVALIWIIHPRRRTVTIYRPDAEPQLVNASEELNGEPHLPGFRVPVADLFV